MYCEICNVSTSINWGNAHSIRCEKHRNVDVSSDKHDRDEDKNKRVNIMQGPMLSGGGEVISSQMFGEYEGVFIKKPDSIGPIKYLFVLIIYSKVEEDPPILFVTSEVNEMQHELLKVAGHDATTGSGEYYLGVFSESGHENLGKSTDWCEFSKFEQKAIEIVKEKLAPSDKVTTSPTPPKTKKTKTETTPKQRSGSRTVIIYFALMFGLFFVAIFHSSDTYQEWSDPYKYWVNKKDKAEEMVDFYKDQIESCNLELRKLHQTQNILIRQYILDGYTSNEARDEFIFEIETTQDICAMQNDFLDSSLKDLKHAKIKLKTINRKKGSAAEQGQ